MSNSLHRNQSYESFFTSFQSYSFPSRKTWRSSIFTKQRTSTEGGRQLIRKKGDEQTGCSFLPLVDKSYEGAVNMRTLVLHLVGRLWNIDGEWKEASRRFERGRHHSPQILYIGRVKWFPRVYFQRIPYFRYGSVFWLIMAGHGRKSDGRIYDGYLFRSRIRCIAIQRRYIKICRNGGTIIYRGWN